MVTMTMIVAEVILAFIDDGYDNVVAVAVVVDNQLV